MSNKITRWIDRNNYKVCLVINSAYYKNKAKGSLVYFYTDILLYPFLLARFLLVFLQLFRFNKDLFRSHPDQKTTPFANKVSHLVAVFFGLRYFVKKEYIPLYYEKSVPVNELWFKEEELPKVSIIISAYNQLNYTLNCLRSLKLNLPANLPVEIIVINDSYAGSTLQEIAHIKGIRVINNLENLGFQKLRREAIESSKGEYLCLLNNNTVILKGWLEALLNTIEKDDSVALVGPKFIHPFGLLQEAGGIVYNDGSCSSYGAYGDTNHYAYNYRREVDYCTGAGVLFRRSDYDKLKGFDSQYIPTYYEDVDLCLSMRHLRKKKVVYQPLSAMVSFESNRLKKDDKSICEANQAKFAQKWEEVLKTYLPIGTNEVSARKYIKNQTLVIIDAYLPRFDKESGSHRIYELIKIFNEMNFHLVFIPHNGKPEQPYFDLLTGNGIEVITRHIGRITFKKDIISACKNVAYIWACRPQLNKKYSYIRRYNAHLKWIYDTVDLHYVRLEREAKLLTSKKKFKKADRFKKLELFLAKKADLTVCITNVEQQLLKAEGIKNTILVPNIHTLPLSTNQTGFEERKDLLFVGSYDHPPNVDAVVWLCHSIMPMVWKHHPDIKVQIVGNNPTKEVLLLASDKIKVHGYVEHLEPFFNSCRVFVAPLRYGAGMKGKIGQSLSFGLPSITTDIGAEGMGLEHQQNILIANTAEDFANCITQLYFSESLWEKLKNNAVEAVKNYTPTVVKQNLESIFSNLIRLK